MIRNVIIFIWRKKNTKLERQSKIITQQTKTIKNPGIVDMKSVIIEHSKTSYKLSKAIKQAVKISQVRGTDKKSLIALYVIKQKKVKSFG